MQLYDEGEYRSSQFWPYDVCAGCVVYRRVNGRIEVLLLTRERPDSDNNPDYKFANSWHLPKGHAGLEETLIQTALRETEEEAGCAVTIQTYLGALQWKFLHPHLQFNVDKVVHYFAAEFKQELHEIDNEHDELAWVTLKEAKKRLGPPNPKGEDEIVRRLDKFLELTR